MIMSRGVPMSGEMAPVKLLSELAIEGADRLLTSTRVQELLATDAGMDGKGGEE